MKETRFKDTEVGRIPADWQLDRLKENFEFKANNTLSRDALSESGIIQDVHYGDVLVKYGSHLDVQKEHENCVSIKPFYHMWDDGSDNYLELVQNISRNFTNMRLFRDRVVNKEQCKTM